METFGDRLKTEREGRGLTIRSVAETLGVDQERLQALERNDFASLPDEATMMACLRAYAACLEVDAELMIEDYQSERERCLRQLDAALPDRAVEVPPPAMPSELARRPSAFPRRLATVAVLATVVLAGAWWMLSRDGSTERSAPAPVEPPVTTQPEIVSAVPQAPPAVPEAKSAPAEPPAAPAAELTGLRVGDHAVGRTIRDRRLVDQSDRFREGRQVWFWNRIEGGTAGERIEHVWLRNGVEISRTALRLGGSTWRTFSSKTLREGSAGKWAVEARDESGRVLARSEFLCFR